MHATDARKTRRLRIASEVHAEAVAIVALRGVLRSIQTCDTPTTIAERLRDLIAVKAARIGLDHDEFDEIVEGSAAVICRADEVLNSLLARV